MFLSESKVTGFSSVNAPISDWSQAVRQINSGKSSCGQRRLDNGPVGHNKEELAGMHVQLLALWHTADVVKGPPALISSYKCLWEHLLEEPSHLIPAYAGSNEFVFHSHLIGQVLLTAVPSITIYDPPVLCVVFGAGRKHMLWRFERLCVWAARDSEVYWSRPLKCNAREHGVVLPCNNCTHYRANNSVFTKQVLV